LSIYLQIAISCLNIRKLLNAFKSVISYFRKEESNHTSLTGLAKELNEIMIKGLSTVPDTHTCYKKADFYLSVIQNNSTTKARREDKQVGDKRR
jgi:hypothetical protein